MALILCRTKIDLSHFVSNMNLEYVVEIGLKIYEALLCFQCCSEIKSLLRSIVTIKKINVPLHFSEK